jgi:hypothetical protein
MRVVRGEGVGGDIEGTVRRAPSGREFWVRRDWRPGERYTQPMVSLVELKGPYVGEQFLEPVATVEKWEMVA